MVTPTLNAMCLELKDYFDKHGFPGFAVAVGHRGSIIHTAADGHADPETGRPMSADTLLRLGSLSKVFTAAAILKLRQDGLLHLEDTLETYFPGCRGVDEPADPAVLKVTIKQILNHTAGFPSEAGLYPYMAADERLDFYGSPENLNYESMCRYVHGCKLLFSPGSKNSYSTIGYLILGRIIEQVTGQSYGTYLKEAILDPAGVGDVLPAATDADKRPAREAAYYAIEPLEGGTPTRETHFKMGRCRYLECRDSSGGLIASPVSLVDAMMRFYEREGSGLFDLESRAQLVRGPDGADPATEQYTGLGWWIRRPGGFTEERTTDPLHMTKLGHTGRTSGAVNLLFRGENGVWAAVQANGGVCQDDWLTLQWALYHIVAPKVRGLDHDSLSAAAPQQDPLSATGPDGAVKTAALDLAS